MERRQCPGEPLPPAADPWGASDAASTASSSAGTDWLSNTAATDAAPTDWWSQAAARWPADSKRH